MSLKTMPDNKVAMILIFTGGAFFSGGGLSAFMEALAFSIEPPGASLGFTSLDFSANFKAQAPIFFASSSTYLIAGVMIIISGILANSRIASRRRLGSAQAIVMSLVGVAGASILVATELRLPGLFFQISNIVETLTFGFPLTMSGAVLALVTKASGNIDGNHRRE